VILAEGMTQILPDNASMDVSTEGAPRLSLARVMLCGAVILTMSMGIRHGFGLWLQPMTMDRGWTRDTFAFAMAAQNLAWGIAGPLAGAVADRFGAYRVMMVGALAYAGGLFGMALATSGTGLALTAGLMIGVAQAGTTYAVVYGIIGRNLPAERRSWAMGVAGAAGSFGQFLMVPVENALIGALGWQGALQMLAVLALLIMPLALFLRESPQALKPPDGTSQSIGGAMREAFGNRSYRLLTAGYFVCGFQVVFIGIHLPSYLKDHGMSPTVATTALALVGLFNVLGTYAAGSLGQRFPKRYILSAIYGLRSVVIIGFLLLPLSPGSVYVFSALMGLLWLSTVPPTNALIAQIFGVQYMSMLSGFAFLSHQIGSFLGAWLGGALYEASGNYDVVWMLAIALGFFAAAINLPVRETPIVRPQLRAA
jgi:MFS family permease